MLQDPTVLRALAPVILDHYPDTIGRVIIAPVNTVLYVIWGLVSLILDDTTKSRMKLLKVCHSPVMTRSFHIVRDHEDLPPCTISSFFSMYDLVRVCHDPVFSLLQRVRISEGMPPHSLV